MKKIATILTTIILMFSLVGCGSHVPSYTDVLGDTERPVTIVAIAGNTANTPRVSCSQSESVMALVEEAFYHSTTSAYIIECDGDPYLVKKDTYEPLGKGYTNSSRKRNIRDACASFANAIDHAAPKTPEVDLLAALNMASNIFKSKPDSAKVLLIARNIFMTSGVGDLTSGALEADANTVIQEIQAAGAIPDLTGVTVFADHLYEAGGSQPKLGYAQQASMKAIASELFNTSGATIGSLFSIPVVAGDEVDTSLPKCTVITPKIETISFSEPVTLSEEEVKFIGDKAEYVSPDKVRSVLQPYADALRDSNESVYLIGSTATGQSKYCQELSMKRAEKVKKTLVSLGVDSSKLHCVGLGCEAPDRVPDTDASGHLVESEASKNRKVVITSVGSEYAKSCGLE